MEEKAAIIHSYFIKWKLIQGTCKLREEVKFLHTQVVHSMIR